MLLRILIDILEQGFIYGLMALGLYISYKILNFPDLSVDGSFPFGAAVCCALLTQGVNPWICLLAALLCGALAGLMTGVFHVIFGIGALFSGILTMTMLYSVNLLVVGKSNQPFFNLPTIFNASAGEAATAVSGNFAFYRTALTAFVLCILAKIVLDLFLHTKRGLLLRAAGDNEQVVKAVGMSPGSMKILGLSIANALAALSGAVLCQQQRFFEISMGTGIMVMGLASVMLGEVLCHRISWIKGSSMAIIGVLLYKALVALAIHIGASASYLNLIRALLFLAVLLIRRFLMRGGKAHA